MSDSIPELDTLEESFAKLRAADEQRSLLILRLLDSYRKSQRDLEEASSDAELSRRCFEALQEELEQANERTTKLQAQQDQLAYAAVIIDGNSMLFADDILSLRSEGGIKAATQLKQDVEDEVEELHLHCPRGFIVVTITVFVDMESLGMDLVANETIPDVTMLKDFVRGFSLASKHVNIVDAGNTRNSVEEKVKAAFHVNLLDAHCKQVFFGGSTVSNYAYMLRPYLEDWSTRARITLIKGRGFAPELSHVQGRFRVVSFDKVFKGADTSCYGILDEESNEIVDAASTCDVPEESDEPVSAAIARRRRRQRARSTNSSPHQQATRHEHFVLLNFQGQRIDTPLRYTPTDLRHVRSQRLCFQDHLIGRCPWTTNSPKGCQLKHGFSLTEGQEKALRALARRPPCGEGLECRDGDCLSGHRCVKEGCEGDGGCRFSKEMHGVDMRIAAS